jgi:integrase
MASQQKLRLFVPVLGHRRSRRPRDGTGELARSARKSATKSGMNLDATPPWLQPHTGLSSSDLHRIGAAVTAARAASTRKVYANLWRQWERWCHARDLDAFPADPMALCAYLAERAESGITVQTLTVACSAIAHVHRVRGFPDPANHHAVREVRRGLRRTYGVAPVRQARPLTPADLRQILGAIDRSTPLGARDAAIILLGYASALRRSELVALTLHDVEPKPGGLLLHPRSSKTDQDAEGAVAGLPAERITAHSLRAGHATTAFQAGVHLDRIAAQTRHRDLSVLLSRYIRPLEALATTSSRDLGL